jgi:hypothetical protein
MESLRSLLSEDNWHIQKSAKDRFFPIEGV